MSEEMEHWQTLADWRWELFPCPYCYQPPGKWCMTAGKRNASRLHGDRGRALIHVAQLVYTEGYEMGQWTTERRVKTA
jgi:hypothetical protein